MADSSNDLSKSHEDGSDKEYSSPFKPKFPHRLDTTEVQKMSYGHVYLNKLKTGGDRQSDDERDVVDQRLEKLANLRSELDDIQKEL